MADSFIRRMGKRWRRHVFPQRSVRNGRYKLIANLLQDRPSPSAQGYSDRNQKWTSGATQEEIADSDKRIRAAYELYEQPPEYEVYDLQNDPWEFENLSHNPAYRDVLQALKNRLETWQEETDDALRHPENLHRLTQKHDEILENTTRKVYGEVPGITNGTTPNTSTTNKEKTWQKPIRRWTQMDADKKFYEY